MKDLLQEIRNQPPHIREIFMWTMVVIVFSVVGFVWFRQTSKQFVALLHPKETQERAFAQQPTTNNPEKASGPRGFTGQKLLATKKPPSPFATIFNTLGGLRANIFELLAGPKPSLDVNNGQLTPEEKMPPQKLPLSN